MVQGWFMDAWVRRGRVDHLPGAAWLCRLTVEA